MSGTWPRWLAFNSLSVWAHIYPLSSWMVEGERLMEMLTKTTRKVKTKWYFFFLFIMVTLLFCPLCLSFSKWKSPTHTQTQKKKQKTMAYPLLIPHHLMSPLFSLVSSNKRHINNCSDDNASGWFQHTLIGESQVPNAKFFIISYHNVAHHVVHTTKYIIHILCMLIISKKRTQE